MRNLSIVLMGIGALALGGCGGNDDHPAAATPPPTSSTPATPAPVDFNVYAVQLALQRDAASETKTPVTVEDQTFSFSDDGSVFASVLPAN